MKAIQMNHVRKINQLLSIALLHHIVRVHAIKSTSDRVELPCTIWKILTRKTSDKNKVYKG